MHVAPGRAPAPVQVWPPGAPGPTTSNIGAQDAGRAGPAIWCIPGVPGKHGGGVVLPRHAGTSYTMVVERRAGSSAPFRAPVHRSATRPNACCSGPAAAATPRNLWWRRAVPAAPVAPVSAVTPDLGEPGGAAPGQATLGRRAVSPPSAARI